MTTDGATISASAMSYVQQPMSSTAKPGMKNAAAALYDYYYQTLEYRKK